MFFGVFLSWGWSYVFLISTKPINKGMGHFPFACFMISLTVAAVWIFVLDHIKTVILVRESSLPHLELQLKVLLIRAIFITKVFVALQVRFKLHNAVIARIRAGLLAAPFFLTVALGPLLALINKFLLLLVVFINILALDFLRFWHATMAYFFNSFTGTSEGGSKCCHFCLWLHHRIAFKRRTIIAVFVVALLENRPRLLMLKTVSTELLVVVWASVTCLDPSIIVLTVSF